MPVDFVVVGENFGKVEEDLSSDRRCVGADQDTKKFAVNVGNCGHDDEVVIVDEELRRG